MRGGVRVPPGKEGRRAKAAPHQSASQTASPKGEAFPRQMFHVEHLPDFFVGKTPFLSLLFVL